MTSCFPDLNVWVALAVQAHSHHQAAWKWFRSSADVRILFCRHTHVGLLRLLTNTAVMGELTLTLGEAWQAYDQFLSDKLVRFAREPEGLEPVFHRIVEPLKERRASKWVGDCYLLAFAMSAGATLITFDRALARFAEEQGAGVLIPS